jgi:PleD family two-component response regulator
MRGLTGDSEATLLRSANTTKHNLAISECIVGTGGTGVRVLVIEDDKALSSQIAGALVKSGYLVEAAMDGEQGHYLGDTSDFDAVVLDLGLPGMNGKEVLRKWRAVVCRC